MACGFNEYSQELFDKIQLAYSKMLLFAAPTNKGNAGEIAYPARHHSEVFCMFSTNGAVTRSLNLNPSKGLGQYNFAILGEDILTLSGEQKSGTSFSTAIAAGLAGRLLDFSRHSDCWPRIRNASIIKLKHGMTKVLLAMAVKDGSYRCLKPWNLLPSNLRNQIAREGFRFHTEKDRENARENICTKISRSLDDSQQVT